MNYYLQINNIIFVYLFFPGEDNSEVHAFLHDGVISATISLPGESIVIEVNIVEIVKQ